MPKELELPVRLSLGTSHELIAKLDAWRRQHPDLPTRAAAARAVLEAGLKDIHPGGATKKSAKAKAPPESRVKLGALMSSLAGTDATKVRAA